MLYVGVVSMLMTTKRFGLSTKLQGLIYLNIQNVILALSQRLSFLDLIFRFSIPTSDKMLLINFRIS